MIRNYIFDLYGTLVDIHTDEAMPSFWRRFARLVSLQGALYSPHELREAYLSAVQEQTQRRSTLLPGIPTEHVEPDILCVFSSLYAKKNLSVSEERIRDAAISFRALSLRHLSLYPDAKRVLRTLRERGAGVYLLSNAQAAFTMPELRQLGLVSFFDGIVLSSDVGIKKPDKAIFEYLLSKYDLCPETCLMVGNDMETDMLGAASAGIAGRYIHTKQSPCRQGPLPDGCWEVSCLSKLLQA